MSASGPGSGSATHQRNGRERAGGGVKGEWAEVVRIQMRHKDESARWVKRHVEWRLVGCTRRSHGSKCTGRAIDREDTRGVVRGIGDYQELAAGINRGRTRSLCSHGAR